MRGKHNRSKHKPEIFFFFSLFYFFFLVKQQDFEPNLFQDFNTPVLSDLKCDAVNNLY